MTPMADPSQDALSLTLPKPGSRTKARRRKIPKPPWKHLFFVVGFTVLSIINALTGAWVSFIYSVGLLGLYWAEMLASMRLRREPWWVRSPLAGVILVPLIFSGIFLILLIGK